MVVAALVIFMGLQVPAPAVTLDFEELADQEALTDQYVGYGVDFGDGARALREGGSLNTGAGWYAPSPYTVIVPRAGSDYVEVYFDMPVLSVGAMYECRYSNLYLKAYDADGGDPLASAWGGPTYYDSLSRHIAAPLGVSDPMGRIRSVRFHDGGSYFLLDDLSFEAAPLSSEAPEPGTWLLLTATGIAGVIARRRRSG